MPLFNDTVQIHYYFDLHQAALASHSAAMRQEADAFMAEKNKEADNPSINKSKYIFHCSLFTFKKCRASPAYCADEDVHNPSVDGLRQDERNKQKTYTLNSFGKS